MDPIEQGEIPKGLERALAARNPFDHLPDRRQALRELTMATIGGMFLTHEVVMTARAEVSADPGAKDGNWGTVKGRVVWSSRQKLPEHREVDFGKITLTAEDRKFFTSKGKVYYENFVVDPNTRGVRHVYVWLRPDSPDRTVNQIATIHPELAEVKVKEVVMDQEAMGFRPHALALRTGQALLVKNTSPIGHAVVWVSQNNGSPNRLMPPGTEFKVENLKPENLPIGITCAPHPWERAWMQIFDHPYFALTDQEGRFEFKLAPGGKWRLVVWQESIGFKDGAKGRLGQTITIEAGTTLDLGKLEIMADEE